MNAQSTFGARAGKMADAYFISLPYDVPEIQVPHMQHKYGDSRALLREEASCIGTSIHFEKGTASQRMISYMFKVGVDL